MIHSRKKVLFVVNLPSPYRIDFFNELGKECDLTVAFEGERASNRNPKWVGDKAIYFKAIHLNGIRIRTEGFLSFRILKVLSEKWEYIFLGGYSTPTLMMAIEYLRIKHIPFYLEVDGGIIATDSKLKYAVKKHFVSAASGWLSTGKTITEFLVHYGAKRDKCILYPFSSIKDKDILLSNITDKEVFCEKREKIRIEAKKRIGVQHEKLLLAVGQIIPRKGYDILLKAISGITHDVELIIVGGEPSKDLLAIIDEKKIENIRFIDFLKKEELVEYYKAADFFVHPTREDIWGLVVNEALAYGLPVITTDKCVAGKELIVNGYNGFLVEAENEKILAEVIEQCIEEKCNGFEYNAKQTALNYTIETMVKKHLEVIEE